MFAGCAWVVPPFRAKVRHLLPVTLLAAGPAHAHGSLAGVGVFYASLSHPFLAWDHLLLLLGIGLLLGRQLRSLTRIPLLALLAGLLAGLVTADTGLTPRHVPLAILGLTIAAGGLLAAAPRLTATALAVLSFAAAAVVGLDTDNVSATVAPTDFLVSGGGLVAGVFLIVLNSMALSSVARRPPFSIAIRVAGSWLVAVALLVLALSVRDLGGGIGT